MAGFAVATDEGRTWLLGNQLEGTTMYVGLLHTADVDTGPATNSTLASITESAGAGYSRQSCVMGTAASQADTGAQVTFNFTGTPTGGAITGWFLATTVSGTGGKLIGAVNITVARTPVNGESLLVTPTVAD